MENYVVHCDGASRGNPGPAAAAFVVTLDGKVVHKSGKRLGNTTNNVAEYSAVVEALSWLVENSKQKRPLTFTAQQQTLFILDSQLVVNQLKGIYKIKNRKLLALASQIKTLEKKLTPNVVYKNVAREKNTIADTLVNQILDDSEKRTTNNLNFTS